jgi:hypothetical protein
MIKALPDERLSIYIESENHFIYWCVILMSPFAMSPFAMSRVNGPVGIT